MAAVARHEKSKLPSSRAIGMIVGAPVMAIATLRLPKRLTLALAIFAAGHVITLAAVAAVVIGRFAPNDQHGAAPSVGSELRALRSWRLRLVLRATVLVMGGCMGTFSFLSPLLTERSGIPLEFVPGGIAAGSLIGGRTLDTALGEPGPATVGVVMVALGLIPLIALAAKRVSRPETSATDHFDRAAQAARA
jgi:predicted MFS family arabinose efflux permease